MFSKRAKDLNVRVMVISDESNESGLEVVDHNAEKLDTRKMEKVRAKAEEVIREMQEKTKVKILSK